MSKDFLEFFFKKYFPVFSPKTQMEEKNFTKQFFFSEKSKMKE